MTSNVKRHVQLPRSSQKGKKPTADDLKYGEIAVNFNVEDPFLAMKGSDDSILTMSFKDGKTGPWKKGEGEYSAVLDNGTPTSPSDKVNTATGVCAIAEGKGTKASGDFSHAEGNESNAKGKYSHAEGGSTTASGDFSHAEGGGTKAMGSWSHTEGAGTVASGDTSHAEGGYTIVNGTNSHGEGYYKQSLELVKNIAIGDTKIYINNSTMNLPVNDDYIKNCFIYSDKKNKVISYKKSDYTPHIYFEGDVLELTLEKPLEKVSNNDDTNNFTFTSDVYSLINIAVGRINGGHSEGQYNIVLGESGHAEGKLTIAKGAMSHTEGSYTTAIGNNSHAEGNGTTAQGESSHVEGINTKSIGISSHAEGQKTTASGDDSHAEGNLTTASGGDSHAEGYSTTASGQNSHAEGSSTTASGNNTHVEGLDTTASGGNSHAEGDTTKAVGVSSHAEGSHTIAQGDVSHSEGDTTKAVGVSSHAEGRETIAMGVTSHAEGKSTNAAGAFSHVEGVGGISLGDVTHVEGLHSRAMNFTDDVAAGSKELYIITNDEYPEDLTYYKNCLVKDNGQTVAIDVLNAELVPNSKFTNSTENKRIKLTLKEGVPKASTRASQATEKQKDGYFNTWDYALHNKGTIGNYGGHAEGSYTMVYDDSGHAEGKTTIAKGKTSHSEGYHTIAGGETSHSEGFQTIASGEGSHAEGSNTTASGSVAHSEGSNTTASGEGSHAEGSSTTASGDTSHAEGFSTIASGNYSHSEGSSTTAGGSKSHAEGSNTIASGENSHAEGYHTIARGNNSHASGSYTIAENETQFVCGTYNKVYANQIFTIGIGIDNNSRKNALSINYDGSITSDVELTHGGTSMKGLSILGGIQASEGMIAPAYLNSSDERLKKNIETISDNDIDKVKNVNLKSYVFKSDNSKHYGVIAQDIEKAGLSELVTNGADGMKSVDYISLLILKISELENEIKNLKDQIKK